MSNPRFANDQGGILIEQDNGVCLYVDSGELYDAILSGEYGPIADYQPIDGAV